MTLRIVTAPRQPMNNYQWKQEIAMIVAFITLIYHSVIRLNLLEFTAGYEGGKPVSTITPGGARYMWTFIYCMQLLWLPISSSRNQNEKLARDLTGVPLFGKNRVIPSMLGWTMCGIILQLLWLDRERHSAHPVLCLAILLTATIIHYCCAFFAVCMPLNYTTVNCISANAAWLTYVFAINLDIKLIALGYTTPDDGGTISLAFLLIIHAVLLSLEIMDSQFYTRPMIWPFYIATASALAILYGNWDTDTKANFLLKVFFATIIFSMTLVKFILVAWRDCIYPLYRFYRAGRDLGMALVRAGHFGRNGLQNNLHQLPQGRRRNRRR